PVLAAAEHARSTGRELITAIVLAYEIYLRFCDEFDNWGYDSTTFSGLATSIASGKLLRLSSAQLAHSVRLAGVTNNMLRQVRGGHQAMFKAAGAGQAGRTGLFAALLARAGMDSPDLPFGGESGWCDHIGMKRFDLATLGGRDRPYKILDSSI